MTDESSRPLSPERAALWSALLPGLGQWLGGRRWRGLLFAIPALAGIAVAVGVVLEVRSSGVTGLVRMLVQPGWLWALVVFNAVLALERVLAVVDAWRTGEPRSVPAWGWLIGAVALLLVTLVPHVVVHTYGMEAISLIDTVFGDEQQQPLAEREQELLASGVEPEDLGPSAPATTVPASTTTADITTTTLPPRPRASTPLELEDITVEPVPFEPDTALGDTYTVLLAGGDFGPGRQDLRTDVMIVAHLDLVAGKVSLIGISRELANVPLPPAWARYRTMIQVQAWHELQAWEQAVAAAEEAGEEPPPEPGEVEPCDCFFDRINYLHVLTANWVRTFPEAPDPGMEALRQTLSGFLGVEIDAYVLVDFAGFVDLVDALGGVDVTVTETMDVGFSPAREGEDPVRIDVEPGIHHLDGRQALAYVRNRTGSSDDERMRRQRCMIRELAAQADPATLFLKFPAIARAIRENTVTTLPLEMLPEIIDVMGGLGAGDIATLAIGARGWARGVNYQNLPIVDAPRVRAAVADLIAGVASGETLGAAEDECAPVG